MLRCRIFGHRYRFRAAGSSMRWECERGCGARGSKAYSSPAEAERYAGAFDREDRDAVGHRPPLGMFPLWLARALRRDR